MAQEVSLPNLLLNGNLSKNMKVKIKLNASDYSEPELTSMYHKNNKLDGIIDKLKTEFLLNYPYIPNTIIKDPAK